MADNQMDKEMNRKKQKNQIQKNEKKIVKMLKSLSVPNKIQLIAASLILVAAFIAIPIYAWFSYQRKLAELQLINSPDILYVTAANVESVKSLEMSGINVQATKIVDGQETPITNKLFPFCVAGEYVSNFTLQLAHTSNNPFDYEIFEGIVYLNKDAAIQAIQQGGPYAGSEYVEYTVSADFSDFVGTILDENSGKISRYRITEGQPLYIVKGASLNSQSYGGGYLNMSSDNRTATTKYAEECYTDYTVYTNYEMPLYWQCRGIESVPEGEHGEAFFRTFIVDVSWAGKQVSNNKETDIVYIMAFSGSN